MLASVLVVGGGAAGCGDETAPDPVPASVPASERADVVRRAQTLVALSPEDLGYRLRTAPARSQVRASIDHDSRTVTLYLRRGDAVHRVAHDLAHELGHAVDERSMTPATRARYLARRGAPDTAWYGPPDEPSDLTVGAGDFAEVFALCTAASPDFRSRVAPRPELPCEELPVEARKVLAR